MYMYILMFIHMYFMWLIWRSQNKKKKKNESKNNGRQ